MLGAPARALATTRPSCWRRSSIGPRRTKSTLIRRAGCGVCRRVSSVNLPVLPAMRAAARGGDAGCRAWAFSVDSWPPPEFAACCAPPSHSSTGTFKEFAGAKITTSITSPTSYRCRATGRPLPRCTIYRPSPTRNGTRPTACSSTSATSEKIRAPGSAPIFLDGLRLHAAAGSSASWESPPHE